MIQFDLKIWKKILCVNNISHKLQVSHSINHIMNHVISHTIHHVINLMMSHVINYMINDILPYGVLNPVENDTVDYLKITMLIT